MTPADLYESTHFVLDGAGRIVSTREPNPAMGPLFSLVRGCSRVVWTVHASVPACVAAQLELLAREEGASADPRSVPKHANRYVALLSDLVARESASAREVAIHHGPAFVFPAGISPPSDVVELADELPLAPHYRGWMPGELGAGRAPAFAVLEDGAAVSVCFSARRSGVAAEAGVETAAPYRGRGLATRVTAAWARSLRDGGRAPLYSTSWGNSASLAVARKLRLIPYASHWRLSATDAGR